VRATGAQKREAVVITMFQPLLQQLMTPRVRLPQSAGEGK